MLGPTKGCDMEYKQTANCDGNCASRCADGYWRAAEPLTGDAPLTRDRHAPKVSVEPKPKGTKTVKKRMGQQQGKKVETAALL